MVAAQRRPAPCKRYEHRLGSVLDLTRQQVALIGLLLLRGPQTLGELFARSERLTRFNDADDVRHHLDRLIQRGLAVQLPRASGQREERYAHLLSGELDVEALQAAAARAAPSPRSSADSSELEARVQRLEATVADLQDALAAVQARLEAAGA
ncbi:hypothetical protein LMG31884_44850 [Xanthomonas hydrangeae]|nr:hypothetical protein LMG31884_44850 [Xanthomonas hydrangeae]CAD7730466.1 hypothetical protein LMG31884_44850 [Xanthomonas hydrangeae]CAD7745600.1 hypothetical protein LMG31887_44770 [Xanthomonas hydrangeae]CAD7745603.1 hypothetical protein LMG31887_44770 [Xanthomonas hydrangeae]